MITSLIGARNPHVLRVHSGISGSVRLVALATIYRGIHKCMVICLFTGFYCHMREKIFPGRCFSSRFITLHGKEHCRFILYRMTSSDIQERLRKLADPVIAEHSSRFFKTGEGEYGDGDQFLGIRVPLLRAHVREFQHISLTEIRELLRSRFHEERL